MACKHETYGCKFRHCMTCEYYEIGNLTTKEYKTNADRIRSMTDEELATYLIRLTEVIPTCEVCEPAYRETGDCNCQCEVGVLNWLKTEIK